MAGHASVFFVWQEAYIQDLDSKSGASLKLTVLNKDGRIWTMVAGGGASVVYAYVFFIDLVLFLTRSACVTDLKQWNDLLLTNSPRTLHSASSGKKCGF